MWRPSYYHFANGLRVTHALQHMMYSSHIHAYVLGLFFIFLSIIMSSRKYKRYSLLTKSKGIITTKHGTIQIQ